MPRGPPHWTPADADPVALHTGRQDRATQAASVHKPLLRLLGTYIPPTEQNHSVSGVPPLNGISAHAAALQARRHENGLGRLATP